MGKEIKDLAQALEDCKDILRLKFLVVQLIDSSDKKILEMVTKFLRGTIND